MAEYQVSATKSAVDILGKSSLHPIRGTLRDGVLSGRIVAEIVEGSIDVTASPHGRVEVPVEGLSFGNSLFDRELPKRLQTAAYPVIVVELETIEPASDTGQHHLGLAVTVRGTKKSLSQQVQVEVPDDQSIVITGEHRFDVRDFGIEPPKKLGMKVHPEFFVKVSLVGQRVTS